MKDSVMRAKYNDHRLQILSEYEVTKGFLVNKITPEEVQSRFLELKSMVKRGETTLKDLEDDIYARYGIVEESREEIVMKGVEQKNQHKQIMGFNIDKMDVLKVSEKSKRNR